MDISIVNNLTTGVQSPDPGFTSAPTPAVEDRRALFQAVHAVNAAEIYGEENELSFAFDRNSQKPVVRIVVTPPAR